MVDPNKWFFMEASPLPRSIVKSEWKGKEIYTYRRAHEVYGVMWIEVIASNSEEARKIVEEVTK